MIFKPADFAVFFLVLVSAIFLILNSGRVKGTFVTVTACGNEYQFSLSKNGVFQVEGEIGITEIEIKDGKVRIKDSACPNKTCVHQGWANTIVCLPNRVIVSVEDGGEFDGIAQ